MMDLSSWLIAALLIADRADAFSHSSLDSLREVLHSGVGVTSLGAVALT